MKSVWLVAFEMLQKIKYADIWIFLNLSDFNQNLTNCDISYILPSKTQPDILS